MFEWNLTSSAQSNLRAQIFAKLIFAEFIFTTLPKIRNELRENKEIG